MRDVPASVAEDSSEIISTTTTGQDGTYEIGDLLPGTYTVRITVTVHIAFSAVRVSYRAPAGMLHE